MFRNAGLGHTGRSIRIPKGLGITPIRGTAILFPNTSIFITTNARQLVRQRFSIAHHYKIFIRINFYRCSVRGSNSRRWERDVPHRGFESLIARVFDIEPRRIQNYSNRLMAESKIGFTVLLVANI